MNLTIMKKTKEREYDENKYGIWSEVPKSSVGLPAHRQVQPLCVAAACFELFPPFFLFEFTQVFHFMIVIFIVVKVSIDGLCCGCYSTLRYMHLIHYAQVIRVIRVQSIQT